jgi:hypothetical protein
MPNEKSYLEEATALIAKANQFIKNTRGLPDAARIGKLYHIVEFQNQALEKLRLAVVAASGLQSQMEKALEEPKESSKPWMPASPLAPGE